MNSTTSHYRIVSCDNKNGEGKEMWLSSKPLGATMKQRQRGFIFRQWKKGPPNYIKTVVQVRETTFTPDKIRYCKKDYHLSVFSWTQIISHLEIVWHSIENLCICLRFGGMQQPFSWNWHLCNDSEHAQLWGKVRHMLETLDIHSTLEIVAPCVEQAWCFSKKHSCMCTVLWHSPEIPVSFCRWGTDYVCAQWLNTDSA